MARRRRCHNYIPEELIFHILSVLPVRSLLRFQLVCKWWQLIISSTRFVQTHLANSRKKQAVLLNYRIRDEYITVHDTHQNMIYKLYLPSCVRVTHMTYINSCDGLVCLSNLSCDIIHIWNPLTRRFQLLPRPNNEYASWMSNLGLGFDPISGDYKVFRLMFKDVVHLTSPPGAQLYSANANSWKNMEIPETLLKSFCPVGSKLVQAKTGVLYMAFDLHHEVFPLYSYPRSGRYVRSYVLDFEGSVAMIILSADGLADLDLYILQEDGCGKLVSWTKMFQLEKTTTGLKIDFVVRYLGCGAFFCRNDHLVRRSFTYNYKKREAKKAVYVHIRSFGMSCAVKYTESLLSLHGFQQE